MKTKRTRGQRISTALTIGALLLPLLTGCAQPRQWTRQGITQEDFDRDAALCRRQTASVKQREPFADGVGLERSVSQEKHFEQCMFAKGYRFEGTESGR